MVTGIEWDTFQIRKETLRVQTATAKNLRDIALQLAELNKKLDKILEGKK